MTDDTDTVEREETERACSLPLIDTFAALEAELAAKTERIERLERELATEARGADGSTKATAEPGTGRDRTDDPEPRSHEDWEPETEPLSNPSTPSADDDRAGVAPATEATREETESDPTEPAGDSGLKPVRTASAESIDTAKRKADETDEARTAREEFGLTMEATADLTGGSLGSSTDEAFPTTTRATSDEGASDSTCSDSAGAGDVDTEEVDAKERPPDPTADRSDRLSRLVRRAELLNDEEVVEAFVRGVKALDDVTRGMLAHYCESDDATPVDAYVAAGGSGERQYAYARNRTLRTAGVIEHDDAGCYRYALPDLVAEAFDGSADSNTLADAVDAIESATDIDA